MSHSDLAIEHQNGQWTKPKKTEVHFYLTPDGHELLNRIAAAQGVTKTAAIELMIRETAKRVGIKLEQPR